MSPYELDRLYAAWRCATHHAVSLGPRAVEDAVRQAAGPAVTVLTVHVGERADFTRVEVVFRPAAAPAESTAHSHVCVVERPPRPWYTWEGHLRRMAAHQKRLAPHLAGLPVNVSRGEYDAVLTMVRQATGYDGLSYGDLWVHKNDGTEVGWVEADATGAPARAVTATPGSLSFGQLTDAGAFAVAKYLGR